MEAEYTLFKATEGLIGGKELIYNVDPLFLDEQRFDLRLDSLSPAHDVGIRTEITTDLLGQPRDAAPDLGAYERQQ